MLTARPGSHAKKPLLRKAHADLPHATSRITLDDFERRVIHMLLSIPPKCGVLQIMGYLKGKSGLKIFDKACEYEVQIQNQIQEDNAEEQLSIQ